MTDTATRAQRLRDLHAAPEILRVVNVWDVISAKAVLALPETRALATAGHSIAASFGYEDGSIPFEITLDMVARIVSAADDVPVTADLDDGYADTGETTRRAIGVGIVGANMEDRLRPLEESAARVAAVRSIAPKTPARVRTWRPTMTFSSAVMLPNRRMFWKVRAMPRSAA